MPFRLSWSRPGDRPQQADADDRNEIADSFPIHARYSSPNYSRRLEHVGRQKGSERKQRLAGVIAVAEAGTQDAIALLKEDHRTVEDLFKQFEKASGDGRKEKLAR